MRLSAELPARRARELEADHELLEGVEDAQGEACAAVEKAPSQEVHVDEQRERFGGDAGARCVRG